MMIKYVEICQRTKQYRLPSNIWFESYDGMTLDELKEKIIDYYNTTYKDICLKHPESKCADVIFEEIEGLSSGIIIG